MPREHATITLTRDELVDFLSGQSQCVVATVEQDGSPWGDVVACRFSDGVLYFRVPHHSRTLKNLEADPRVCCTLESKDADYYSARAAMVHGRAVLVTASEGSLPELDALPDPVTAAPIDATIFAVDLENVVSFDFGKIQRRFDQ